MFVTWKMHESHKNNTNHMKEITYMRSFNNFSTYSKKVIDEFRSQSSFSLLKTCIFIDGTIGKGWAQVCY